MTDHDAPSHLGHRQRLRERFLAPGGDNLPDYELLEMILFAARPRGDVKPLAKRLIKIFGSFDRVLAADPLELLKVDEVGESVVATLKTVQVAARRLLKAEVAERPVIQSWTSLLDYCRLAMGSLKVEEFRILFLNHKNMLLADEAQQRGTIDHAPVYPREVVKRALELGASALILVHNHPSGDPTPSKADILLTQQIMQALATVNIALHDHLVIAANKHYSFKSNGLI